MLTSICAAVRRTRVLLLVLKRYWVLNCPQSPAPIIVISSRPSTGWAPDEWVLVSQSSAAELEAELRQALSGHISIVDISGGQTVINLRGAQSAVQTLLKKSSVYDFAAWPQAEKNAGRCAQTTFAKASAVISNKSDGSFDLIVRRSFADYIARWLLDAGQEFGCRIEG